MRSSGSNDIEMAPQNPERRIVVGAMPGKIGQIAFTVFL
jgi:hypothetical protein